MKYLLDTHILLWAIRNEPDLTEKVKRIITDPANEIFVSVASEWEVAIKTNIGKLKLKPNFASFLKQVDELNVERLAIDRKHLIEYEKLPLHHRDPFDRMLIAQAKAEKLTLITHDKSFKKYKVKLLWN